MKATRAKEAFRPVTLIVENDLEMNVLLSALHRYKESFRANIEQYGVAQRMYATLDAPEES